MSLDRLIFVQCDGCGRACGTIEELQETAKDARKTARSHNWRTSPKPKDKGFYDWCPQCWGNQPHHP